MREVTTFLLDSVSAFPEQQYGRGGLLLDQLVLPEHVGKPITTTSRARACTTFVRLTDECLRLRHMSANPSGSVHGSLRKRRSAAEPAPAAATSKDTKQRSIAVASPPQC